MQEISRYLWRKITSLLWGNRSQIRSVIKKLRTPYTQQFPVSRIMTTFFFLGCFFFHYPVHTFTPVQAQTSTFSSPTFIHKSSLGITHFILLTHSFSFRAIYKYSWFTYIRPLTHKLMHTHTFTPFFSHVLFLKGMRACTIFKQNYTHLFHDTNSRTLLFLRSYLPSSSLSRLPSSSFTLISHFHGSLHPSYTSISIYSGS